MTPDEADELIDALARVQFEVVSHQVLRRLGVSEKALRHRVRSRRLHPLHRGVSAVVPPRALSWEGRQHGAVLACGPRAASGYLAAGRIHELRVRAREPEVVVPRSVRHDAHDGIRIHRSRCLRPEDVTVRNGLVVTTSDRTIVDLAEVLTTPALRRATEQAEYQRLAGPQAPINGRRGSRRLVTALALVLPGGADERSVHESDFFDDVVVAHRLSIPARNTVIEGMTVDFAWIDERVVVEVDARGHDLLTRHREDLERDRRLRALGWESRRYSDIQIATIPELIAAELRQLLHARRGWAAKAPF